MRNNKQPLVSIIVPAYNGMPYLEAAIDSILAQTYPAIELIVLDDGSTDGTAEFLQQYRGKFYFDSHENMGQVRTLNKGWAISKGEILSYLSADDLLSPNAVEESLACLKANPQVVLSYPDNYLIDDKSRFIRTYTAPDYDFHDLIANAACRIGVGAFFRRELFEVLGGWDDSYHMIPDYAYQLRAAKMGSFKHIPKVLGSYRIHKGSASYAAMTFDGAEETSRLLLSFLSSTEDKSLLTMKNVILAQGYLLTARNHWRSGRYCIAIKRFSLFMRKEPKLLFSSKTYRLIINAVLNRAAHRVLCLSRNFFWRLAG
jgi:glycosyltransferase involved in cell wall biosynthesis